MRVLGIDCGTELTGFGIVEQGESGRLRCLTYGAIKLVKTEPMGSRLRSVFVQLSEVIREFLPDAASIEEVFYSVNAKSALKLGQVRGVALMTAAASGLVIAEYAPLAVKSAVCGYGRAEKEQVQFMVAKLLGLAQPPQPADAADALALAICHIHTSGTMARQRGAGA